MVELERLKKGWVVYIIETESGRLYTGITNDLVRRFQEHLSSKQGAKFFHLSKPVQVLFQEAHADRSSASIREAQIKKLTRMQKLRLCEKGTTKKSIQTK